MSQLYYIYLIGKVRVLGRRSIDIASPAVFLGTIARFSGVGMPSRVTLDAMIPREDFAYADDAEFSQDPFQQFGIDKLHKEAPILKLLRKPDFQRETNQWSPQQVATFIASFLDNEVIPSLILWRSPSGFIFVIDGGHRLSALRAWMEDDYGDRKISQDFYGGELTNEQKRLAKRARSAIEKQVGRFTTLSGLVGSKDATDSVRRANRLFTRTLHVQWVQGDASVAETSFYKINSQGTPLDDTEELLIRNRRKPIAIGARAILRSGSGHKYWSSFDDDHTTKIEELAADFHKILFRPEAEEPLKTLELPLGGSVSPLDALSLLVEFLAIAGAPTADPKPIAAYEKDEIGTDTVSVLRNALQILERVTGNSKGSLGLHPAVYFYNEKGKYSRFLFLGMAQLITERVRNNDKGFFRKFTAARFEMEKFLIENKSLIGILLQNMAKYQRVAKMRDLFGYLVGLGGSGKVPTVEEAIGHLNIRGRVIDAVSSQAGTQFSDDTKSMVFLKKALNAALVCPYCNGKLDPGKSISFDHGKPIKSGGDGDADNCNLMHPYCNSIKDSS